MGIKVKIPKIILIGGSGRSGTNVTKRILAKHPKVAILPFEYRFLIDPDGIIDFYNSYSSTWSPFIADIKIKRLENYLFSLVRKGFFDDLLNKFILKCNKDSKKISTRKYYGWELNKWFPGYKQYVKELIKDLKDFQYSGCWPGTKSYKLNNEIYFSNYKTKKELAKIFRKFLYKCINSLLNKQNKEVFVEDNTWNILFAKELSEILPEAKLIHIKRDPKDVVASMIGQRWCPSNFNQALLFFKSIISKWERTKNELPSDYYIEINLEDIVKDKVPQLKKICHFLGLEFYDNILDVDLSQSHKGRWQIDFNKYQQNILRKEFK